MKEAYTNPELSLKSLADDLGTNTSYLSSAVNSHYNCNLPSLINKYRIDKARHLMVSDEFKHYSMEGIALEVGFKSRSVFYQSFKIITGLSPNLYVENYKLVISD
ncbi:MAG: AraC family transcriptional regulator [Bacteroidota bacterium]